MGVNITGVVRPPSAGPAPVSPQDPEPLFVARVVKNIGLTDGTTISTIPSGTLVVIWDKCFEIYPIIAASCGQVWLGPWAILTESLEDASLRCMSAEPEHVPERMLDGVL